MVNGYLPSSIRQEDFAECRWQSGGFCPFEAVSYSLNVLFYIDFCHWHGFCNSIPVAGLGEAGGMRKEDAWETAAFGATKGE